LSMIEALAGGVATARLRRRRGVRCAALSVGVLLLTVAVAACSTQPTPEAPKEKFPFLYYDPCTY
jgi:hypothetical protein